MGDANDACHSARMARWGSRFLPIACGGLLCGAVACGAPPDRGSTPRGEPRALEPPPPVVDATPRVSATRDGDPMIDQLAVVPVPMGPPPPPPAPPPSGLGRGGGGVGEGTIGLGRIGTVGSPPRTVMLSPDDPPPACDDRCRVSERRARVSVVRGSSTAIALRARSEDVSRSFQTCFYDARVADPCVGDRAEVELVVVRGGPVALLGARGPWVQCALERLTPMRLDAALSEGATSGRIAIRLTWLRGERRWTTPRGTFVQPIAEPIAEPSCAGSGG